ncbi:PucR family transcriptional regulator [Haloechinothrix halophila]|uniref:PucR family transcriptional regulator n=1 Tax=Haloechinothrix halophila TaxID=1069073 RepID=UPI000411FBBA|nr:PucR family transcriptional regulator [Haloechinothrix halophila]
MVKVDNDELGEGQQLTGATYGLPLRSVLTAQSLSDTTVLAGANSMDRVVAGLNVMEVPDIVAWVKPDELLLTTGFPLVSSTPSDHSARTSALVQLVRDLDKRGLAGLAIKFGRYLHELPAEVITVADELGFPLLRLPDGVAFDDVLKEVYTDLSAAQATVLEQIDALHSALTMLVLEGGDLAQIAAEVARVLSVGVVITSTDGRERASALTDDDRAELVAAKLFDDTGRFRVERVRLGPEPVAGGQVRMVPVAAGGTDLARIAVFSPDRTLAPSDVSALERAATVSALLITRQQAVTAVESKYRGDFLRDVFQRRAGNNQHVLDHAAGLGWNLNRPLVVLVAELDPTDPAKQPAPARTQRAWQDRFATAWRQVLETRDRTIAVVDFSAEVVALLPVAVPLDSADADSANQSQAVERQVASVVSSIRGDRGGGRRSFSAGVSRIVDDLDQLPSAYGQARRAVEVGRRIKGPGDATHFDELGVHRLLSLVPDPEELRLFATQVLGELADDTAAAADLRTTLQILLDTNLNVAEAARLQHFHYNTMRYRITKLESLLGPFSSDPHLRLDIAVALRVCEMRG